MATQPIDPTKNLGDDATATFEADPKFIEPTPGSEGSSDNVEEQRTALAARDTDDLEDSDEEDEDDDIDEDEEFDEDEDADSEEDLDGEDDEEYEDDDEEELDDDEDEEEDDADEVAASPALRADGLLGYEDEAEDVEKGRTSAEGNATRRTEEFKLKNDLGNLRGTDEDDDEGDVAAGVTEDEVTDDDLDTDRIAAHAALAAKVMAARDAAVLRSSR